MYNRILLAGSIAVYSAQSLASGFQLHEQSAALLGEFYAGSAAVAEDASTNYYNPAGLVYLDPYEFSVGAVNISTYSEFDGTVNPTPSGLATETGTASGGTGRLVPNLHVTAMINDKLGVGFSATSPFGLGTSWGEDSLVRSQVSKAEIETMNLGPSVAYAITDWFSIGVGADAQYSETELDSVATLSSSSPEAAVKNTASSWAWGYHAGAMVQAPTGTRVGLNFRSEMSHHYEGTSRSLGHESDITSDMVLPWLIDLSAYQEFGYGISGLATISYVHWSSIQELVIEGVQVPNGGGATGTSTDTLNYSDTWTFLAGLRYQMSETIMWKMGGGYDQTPTNDTDRDLMLPDENRWIASAGLRWTPLAAKFATIDIGYAHLFPETASINKTNSASTATGNVDGGSNLFGIQLSLRASELFKRESNG